jgi:hypothetical protein
MAYDNSWVPVVYNVLTAPQLQQVVDNIEWLHDAVTASAGVNGVSCFHPFPITNKDANQQVLTANRIFCTRIHLTAQCKVDGFYGYNSNATATRFGAGIYTIDGTTLLCSGVTAPLGNVAVPITCAATLIPAGVYWLAMTGDAAGALHGQSTYAGGLVAALNSPDVTFGYTATTSAAGVLPATIALPLTATNVQSGPFANWALHTATY